MGKEDFHGLCTGYYFKKQIQLNVPHGEGKCRMLAGSTVYLSKGLFLLAPFTN